MDTVARFDRFKFMVIFPETAPDGATHPLERVIEQVRTYDWGVPGMQGAVSVGAGGGRLADVRMLPLTRGALMWARVDSEDGAGGGGGVGREVGECACAEPVF